MTHRDPLQAVPSYVSVQAVLYKLSSRVPDAEVGAFWLERLIDWMHRFEEARARIGEDRFIDIDYREVARAPLVQARRVLAKMRIDADQGTDAVLEEFVAGNRREQRPAHEYSADRFCLDEGRILEAFGPYRARYISR